MLTGPLNGLVLQPLPARVPVTPLPIVSCFVQGPNSTTWVVVQSGLSGTADPACGVVQVGNELAVIIANVGSAYFGGQYAIVVTY